jgi:outer membrane protein assembly factor BamC
MRFLPLVSVSLACVALGGCGWLVGDEGYFRDRSDDYREARAIPPMVVPEEKKAEAISQLYVIPVERTDALLAKEFEVPRPIPLVGDPEENVVRIQKLGEEQWILLDGAPGESWPRVRAFLISNQIGIEREDAASGVMETGWLSFKSEPDRREKYRIRVEQGVQRNSSEIYVQQLGYKRPEGQDVEAPDWGSKSTDAEREAWMVRELAGYMAETGEDASVSLLAQGISTVNKVYLIRDAEKRPAIDLRLPFDRAWASMGRALERAEFKVQDLDRSTGMYYATYEPGQKDGEEEKKGMFKRMFSWWGDDDEVNPAIGRSYRFTLQSDDDGVMINVTRDDGKEFDEGEAEFLLGLVKAHLA